MQNVNQLFSCICFSWFYGWIDNSIKDSQIFPRGYTIFRNDRNLSGGGVLIAEKNTYIATATPELQTECEIVWCRLELVVHKAIYIFALTTTQEHQMKRASTNLRRAWKGLLV